MSRIASSEPLNRDRLTSEENTRTLVTNKGLFESLVAASVTVLEEDPCPVEELWVQGIRTG